MATASEFDAIFGVGIPEPTEIPTNEEQKVKRYALSIYERMQRLRNFAPDEEITDSNQNANQSSSIVFSDDSLDITEPEAIDVKEFIMTTVDGTVRLAPTFKTTRKHAEWAAVLDHHESRLNELIHYIRQVEGIRYSIRIKPYQ
jgi:hypothetical protein